MKPEKTRDLQYFWEHRNIAMKHAPASPSHAMENVFLAISLLKEIQDSHARRKSHVEMEYWGLDFKNTETNALVDQAM